MNDELRPVRSQQPERQPSGTNSPDKRTWTSEQLLRGASEVVIQHGDETYRLRLTRQGKLILHK